MEVRQIQHLRSSLQLALTSAESIGVRDSKLPSEKKNGSTSCLVQSSQTESQKYLKG
jgi:hypothetical protein